MGAPIVVVGGGPAGSAAAILLARRGARVILFDSARFPRRKACAEYVSPGGVALLADLGIEPNGRFLRGMAIHAPGGACHLVQYCGGQRQGLSIDRLILDTALLDLARQHGVEVREGCRVLGVTTNGERVTGVHLQSGDSMLADTVIGADGLHSVVSRIQAPPPKTRWPRRLGLVAHYRGVAWPEPYGHMWVSPHGYVGAAPPDHAGRVTVGLVGPLHRTHFDTALQHYPELADRLRQGQREHPVIGIGPLARRVRHPDGPGYLLVGDAAGFFDPFTGEGIYRALRGAHLVERAICDNQDYRHLRTKTFATKERLTQVIQLFVQSPTLLNLALRRLQARPQVAAHLGNMLGDLEPARLQIVFDLLRP